MNFEEFITPQAAAEEQEEEVAAPEELDVQKAVVESLAADKVVQDEKIACLTREKEELAKALNAAESRLAEMQKQIEELRKTLEGYGDILAKNTEEKASTQITLLERHEELDERFSGEFRDHVIEVIREARDSAEKEGRVRRAQILESVLVANDPVGELSSRRAKLEKLFADNGNILTGNVLSELKKQGISHKEGEEYLLPAEILKRSF